MDKYGEYVANEGRKSFRRQQILQELSVLDSKSLRSLRSISAGESSEVDGTTLRDLEDKAQALRVEFGELAPSEYVE
jgi:hypothetical protein